MVAKSIQQALLASSIAATSAVVLFAGSAPAQAAPPCKQWAFNGPTRFQQEGSKWALGFNTHGTELNNVRANDGWGGGGRVSGSIDGYSVNLFVRWDSGPAGPYEGSVDVNGYAHGHTYDVNNPGSSAAWNSQKPLKCTEPA